MKILITGGQSLIGQTIGQARLKKGDEVILTSSQKENLKSFSKDFEKLQFDLAAPKKSEKDLDKILAGGLDGLILNAVTPSPRLAAFAETDWSEAEKFLSANINGNMWLLQKVLPVFKKQKFGRIVFISSLTTEHPAKGYAIYASAKAAIENLIKYIAVECGEYNITANTIRLGIFKTERNKAFWRRDSIRQKMEERMSLGRLGDPADVVPTVDSLLEKNCYLQGATIDISGGLHIPM